MARKYSRRIVVDASVARACGADNAVNPVASRCRDSLRLILSVCHRVVFNIDIRAEWQRHQSSFARRWLVEMKSRRKVITVRNDNDPNLLAAIIGSKKDIQDALLKDLPIVEAALHADGVILALDDRAREDFSRLRDAFPRFKRLKWLNPAKDSEQVEAWLKAGK